MRHIWLTATLLALAATAGVSPASANGGVPSIWSGVPGTEKIWLVGDTAADRIQAQIVILKRTPRGAEMEIRFQLHLSNLPQEKLYRLYMMTGYMQKHNLPVADLSKTFGLGRPSATGGLGLEFGAMFYKGEWIQFRLLSTDGTIDRTFRFVLFK